jgi:hypothetical protein
MKTRITLSVRALIVPPFPAPSLPSNTMQTFAPVPITRSCSLTNSNVQAGLQGDTSQAREQDGNAKIGLNPYHLPDVKGRRHWLRVGELFNQ